MRLPVGGVPVAPVEDDECLADRCDVAGDRSRLGRGEVDRLVRGGVVFRECRCASSEAPVLDDVVRARGCELLSRRGVRRRLVASDLQRAGQFSHCGAVLTRGAERIGRLVRDVGEGQRAGHIDGLRAPDERVCRKRRICCPASARSSGESAASRCITRCWRSSAASSVRIWAPFSPYIR